MATKPDFIEAHLNRTQKHKLLIATTSSLSAVDYELEGAKFNGDGTKLHFPLEGQAGTYLEIVGLCNGLACIMPQRDALLIFSPTTGESMRVPDSPPIKTKTLMYGNALYSCFGYAPSTKDYRIVKLNVWERIVLLFSLNDKSWRRVEDIPYFYGWLWTAGEPLNRSFHWLVEGRQEGAPPIIVAFDLADEEFSVLPLSGSIHRNGEGFSTGIFGGCLYLLEGRGCGSDFSFWIMEKYGVKESLTRIRFRIHDDVDLQPICYWKTTKRFLAIVDYRHLMVCSADLGEDETKHLGPIPPNEGRSFYIPTDYTKLPIRFYVYVESLVSPKF